MCREGHDERCADFEVRIDFNAALVFGKDFLADVKPKSGSFLFGGIKRIEKHGNIFSQDSGTVVLNPHTHDSSF